jgi:glycosyltransferase involved in cell wall biosynthesis
MPRVLRLLNRLNIGGPTLNAVNLTLGLAPEFETLLVAGMRDASEGDSSFVAEAEGIRPHYLAEMQREIRPWQDLGSVQELRKLIRQFRPDIVHTHAAKAGAVGRIAAALEGVPVRVHTFHGHVFHSYFSPLKTQVFLQVERGLARLSTGIVAISESQRHELVEVYRVAPAEKVHVVQNGFDLSRFDQNAELRERFRGQYQLGDTEVAVGIVGRMVPVKNHGLFLEAMARLSQQVEVPVRAFLIGDGELRSSLEQRARELGFDSEWRLGPVKLEWTSWIEDMERAYAGLDLVVLCSLNEGTPVSLIEAQAAGLPVVSTRVGGVHDVVHHEHGGLLTESANLTQLTDALVQLVGSAEQRTQLGQAGSANVRAQYGRERLVREMAALYRQLLALR